jgi:sortase (surface protein transpeptidase)
MATAHLPDVTTKKKRSPVWLVVAIALIAAGIVVVFIGLHGPTTGPTIPGPIGRTDGVVHAATPQATLLESAKPVTKVPKSIPVHLSIPAIGVSTSLQKLGLNSDGSVEVPTSWYQAGWYKYDKTPGQKGSAVILGHVDSVSGPAVFYRLASLRPGNRVTVTLADGATVRFTVIGLRMYQKKSFPVKTVFGSRKYSALQLVTCSGVFDSATHHYLSNLVVFTKFVSATYHHHRITE